MTESKFGKLADLGNEATVEQFFVARLLKDLGYKDGQIKPKATIDELKISKGRKSEKWRPDYAVTVGAKVRWICEAKGVEEDLDDWVGQSQSYCLALNSTQSDNPVEFFMLTNGVTTRVYRWDDATPWPRPRSETSSTETRRTRRSAPFLRRGRSRPRRRPLPSPRASTSSVGARYPT
ncbi:type I restriction enzyme HsdR N-terminal domain-containing protein [Mobilicoccus caccae]|uniref:Type I restriction enzyme R protein N-terminal domain-containing protein n=1 Tax=Mobilicoccus caccae TaxID=1859295 RepID=A0ABQ6IWU3_9MICO|nr:type I restriction enzyme HsdR N-terminal domain-containing protein [Mobilicoccus caccae]GMA42432.1 hypothetical protein GCM10025883_44770 [Mobilicoccus caccae]